MNAVPPVLARAITDAQDRVLQADEPLASLQVHCGGEMSGTLAIPELLEVVRLARMKKALLTRQINAFDGAEHICAWVDVVPMETQQGCEILLRTWQTGSPLAEDGHLATRRRAATERAVAELTVILDAQQRIFAAHSCSPALASLQQTFTQAAGQFWTEVLPPVGLAAPHTLHWRLLDGVAVDVPGSARQWRVSLVPQMPPGAEPTGFDLLLTSEQPEEPVVSPLVPSVVAGPEPLSGGVVAQDLAPALRQPISRVIANAETIRSRLAGPLPSAYADYAGEIVAAGQLLAGLLDDFADLEVVEDAGFRVDCEEIDLVQAARQAAGILNVRALEKDIRVEAPQLGHELSALGEFRRVLQILLNLVGNAIRYSPAHSHVRLEVEAGHVGQAHLVHVIDEGPGLTDEEQTKVFDRFERLGRSGDGGSGLGLYISRRLARAMGGDVSVSNNIGQGARFTLRLPSIAA